MSLFSNPFDDLNNTNTIMECGIAAKRMSQEHFQRAWPKWLFQLTFASLGLLGNTLIIFTFRNQLKTNVTNYFIFCLAIIDWVSCGVAIPLHIFHTARYFDFHDGAMCKIISWLRTGLWASSSITLMSIALDRYQAVCRPFSWRKIGSLGTIVKLSVCASTGLIVSCPQLIIMGIQRYTISPSAAHTYGFSQSVFYNSTVSSCYLELCEIVNVYQTSWQNIAFSTMSFTIFIFLVTLTMICYTCVYLTMRRHLQIHKKTTAKNQVFPITVPKPPQHLSRGTSSDSRTSATNQNNITPSGTSSKTISSIRQNQFRGARTFLIVTVFFLGTFVPFWIQALLSMVDPSFNNYYNIDFQIRWDFFRELYFLNATVNVCVYYVFNTTFRQYCRGLFLCKKPSDNVQQ